MTDLSLIVSELANELEEALLSARDGSVRLDDGVYAELARALLVGVPDESYHGMPGLLDFVAERCEPTADNGDLGRGTVLM